MQVSSSEGRCTGPLRTREDCWRRPEIETKANIEMEGRHYLENNKEYFCLHFLRNKFFYFVNPLFLFRQKLCLLFWTGIMVAY